MENLVKITAHAADRMWERFGFESADVKQNIAERAWKNGKTYHDYSGKAARFLYSVQTKVSESGVVVKTYANKFFVFNTAGELCTAYQESELFRKQKSKQIVWRENKNYLDFEEGYYVA